MTRERIEDMREVVLPFVKKRLLETNYENLGESDAEMFAKDFDEILNLAIKALEQETRWIPVSERLPKVADRYTVTRQIGDDLIVSACYFDGINNWHNDNWINHERNYVRDIVAWMEKPQPYKKEGEE